jgi:tetratricopeptide (TPR) repeat protein
MSRDNILFGIVGLLAGLIIGFAVANSINKQALAGINTSNGQTGSLPAGHPNAPDSQSGSQSISGAVPEVQAAIEKAKAEPDNFDAQTQAATLYEQIRRFDGAIDFRKRANQINPNDYVTIVKLGNDNYDSDKFEEAEKWYSIALSKKPDDVDVRTDMGLTFVLRDKPDYDRAIQEFKRSLEYRPDHTKTLQNLTVAYIKKGNAENASATLTKLETLDKSNPAISKLRSDIEALKSK